MRLLIDPDQISLPLPILQYLFPVFGEKHRLFRNESEEIPAWSVRSNLADIEAQVWGKGSEPVKKIPKSPESHLDSVLGLYS